MNILDQLLPIIKSAFDEEYHSISINVECMSDIEKKARQQNIMPIVIVGLKKMGYEEMLTESMKNSEARAVFDYVQRKESLRLIECALTKEKLDFIPLKGSVLRDLYPEPWMRTSSDIDVLVHDYEIEKACESIAENTDFVRFDKGFHDVHFKNSRVHLELHYNLLDDIELLDKVFEKAWTYAVPVEGCLYKFTPEYQLFYITAHACKHFLGCGGVGIRPLLDIWLLKTKTEYNEDIVNELFSEAGIKGFYETCSNLLSVWFDNAEHTDITRLFEKLTISGGVFGSKHSEIIVTSRKDKSGFIKSRLFIPASRLKAKYQVCKKYPFLIPFYQMKRWTKIVHRTKKIKNELDTAKAISQNDRNEFEWLLKQIEL